MKNSHLNLKPLFFAVFILFSMFSPVAAHAQTHTPKTVNINANCKGYYEYLPSGYAASATGFPLLVYCGGAGTFGTGTSSQLSKLLTEGPPYYITQNQFPSVFTVNGVSSSFIVISPQFVAWPAPGDVEALLNYLVAQNYKIDQARIYLAGFSAGGDVTWKFPNTGIARAKRLAAIVPVSAYNYPYVDTGAKYIAQANLPVWALHSNDDQTAPVTWSQNFVNKVNSFNPPTPAIITRFSGVAHDPTKNYVYNPTFRNGGYNVYEWMLLNRRNFPPVVSAGPDQTITFPVRTVSLAGSGSDPEGTSVSFSWSKYSGPSAFAFSSTTTASTTISGLVAGVYQFLLTGTDGYGYSVTDTVKVTVVNPSPNIPPAANAGADISLSLPVNSALLNGNGSADADGSIESYSWAKLSGPSGSSLLNAGTASATAGGLKKGIYQFELTVTDNQGATGKDTVLVTVINPFPNIAPVANAGADQTITLPLNTVSLNGAASYDPDGEITAYTWSKVAGPGSPVISGSGAVTTQVTGLLAGTYRFELKVTDDSSAVARDTVDIVVLPAPTLTSRYVRVNIYGGTNPYNQDGWNNWNATGSTNISSSVFNYSDGGVSAISGVLSYSQGISDNGASYGGTVCPPQVLRYTSYSTASTRNLTIRGLNNNYKYDLEFYASRANTGNTTAFVINGITRSVVTDNNKTQSAVFTDLVPVNGQLVVAINKSGTFTYLNGFTLIEKSLQSTNNQQPVAQAGPDKFITLPVNQVQLTGTGIDPDGSIAGYAWSKISGPASFSIGSPANATTTISSLIAGTYLFELKVTDNLGGTARDTVQVIVADQADSINCGRPFRIVILGSSTAYGTGASPLDSSWANKFAGYILSKNAQSVFVNLATLSLTTYEVLCPTGFIPPAGRPQPDTNRNITKALQYSPDAIIINLPTNDIALGIPQQESKDNYFRTLALTEASGIPVWVTTTQPRNTLSPAERTYLMEFRDWTYQQFGSKAIDFWTDIANADGTINDFYSAGDGVHINNSGHQLFFTRVVEERILDSLCLRKNLKPVAIAGPDTSIVLPVNSVQLSAAGSTDPDGSIMSWNWSVISGPGTYSFSNAAVATPLLSGLVQGVYTVKLEVTDNLGAKGTDTLLIYVQPAVPNEPPVAVAGADIEITLPVSSVQLNAGGSFDPDGSIAAYSWSRISGPQQFSFSSPSGISTTLSNLQEGVYLIRLQVTDNQGAVAADTIMVTVNPGPVNLLPVARAGADVLITLPVNSTELDGSSSSDADGTIVSYQWTKISGPSQYNIAGQTTAIPMLSNLVSGIYGVRLVVTDDLGGTAADTVLITVNTVPVANAGADQSITLPVSSANISGSASSDDGTITSYQWTVVSIPAGAAAPVFSSPGLINTSVSNLVTEGVYRIRLTVTDNFGYSAADEMDINVLPQPLYTSKYLKVNLYGGSNPYTTGGWNNWTIPSGSVANVTSANFNYDDNSVSGVSAVLSYTQGVSDNGANYGGTMCPPQVLRYASYTTVNRTLTLRGLNNAFSYDLEFYASRANTGNSTTFTINGVSRTVNTSSNLSEKVVFTGVSPVNGQIVVSMARVNTYNYLNGFILTENSGTVNRGQTLFTTAQLNTTAPGNLPGLRAYPNPFNNDVQLSVDDRYAGPVTITISDASGRQVLRQFYVKQSGMFTAGFSFVQLPYGIYFVQLQEGDKIVRQKLIRVK